MRTLDVCLAVLICGDNGISRDPLDVFLVINLRVPPMNLCIGVGTRFRLDSLVETLGHSLKFFVLVE